MLLSAISHSRSDFCFVDEHFAVALMRSRSVFQQILSENYEYAHVEFIISTGSNCTGGVNGASVLIGEILLSCVVIFHLHMLDGAY